jgi:hypothetical protein
MIAVTAIVRQRRRGGPATGPTPLLEILESGVSVPPDDAERHRKTTIGTWTAAAMQTASRPIATSERQLS